MMSQNGQLRSYGDGAILVAESSSEGRRYDWHRHAEHQLAWAASGILTVSSAAGTWVLPPAHALWIPAGTVHTMDADRHTTVCCPYFGADRGPRWTLPTVVAVSALARELILHLATADPAPVARRRAESVLLDQLAQVSVTTIAVPMPRDPRALAVAHAVIDNPSDDATLEVWARRTSTSTRTLARLFAAETGMPFGRWRTHVRLRAALPLLAGGMPVATAARQVGYTTPSAFVAVFRKVAGVTPGTYFTGRKVSE